MSESGQRDTSLRALAERVRASMWWIVGAFGSVALLLLPGIKLADIGALEGWREYAAAAAVVVALLAILAAAISIASFLRLGDVTLEDLTTEHPSKRDRELRAYLSQNTSLLRREANDLAELRRRHDDALATLTASEGTKQDARLEWLKRRVERLEEGGRDWDVPDPGTARAARPAQLAAARLTVLQQTVDGVDAVATFQQLRSGFDRRRVLLAGCASVLTLAMLGFSYAAHPPKPSTNDLSNIRLVGLDLSGTDLRDADFHGTHFDHVTLDGADLDGADLHDTSWHHTTCPDGTDSDSDHGTCAQDLFIPDDLKSTADRLGPEGGDGGG